MFDILAIIPRKKRTTGSGWIVFDGVCCHNRGHKPDRRSRAGVKFSDATNWTYHCFNCQFKCTHVQGKTFSSDLKSLLTWSGLDEDQIRRLNFQNLRERSALDLYRQRQISLTPEFTPVNLPENARPLDPEQDTVHVEYLARRGLTPSDYTFYVVDHETRTRIIIPYYYQGKIVGNTSRYYDNRHPKYISEQQKGYVFNIDAQQPEWQVCILVEGQFDAISIGGCAYMSNTISEEQAVLLRKLHKTIIVVPDRDKAGLEVCDRALELGFQVSIPPWAQGIKDVNDAVVKYGRLPSLLSILQHATSSRIIVEMTRKKLQ